LELTRLNQGEKVAGISGVALFLIMIIFKWFGLKASAGIPGGPSFSAEITRNAFGSYGFIDIVLFVTVIAAVGLALIKASDTDVSLPVAASAIVAGLGIISVVLIIISIISPPDFGGVSGSGIDNTRKIGVFLGLIAAAAVAYGGYLAMQEEGTTFGDQADRLRDRPGGGPGAGPPPPPPPSSGGPPPTSGGPPPASGP
jgi:hypothetical protein